MQSVVPRPSDSVRVLSNGYDAVEGVGESATRRSILAPASALAALLQVVRDGFQPRRERLPPHGGEGRVRFAHGGEDRLRFVLYRFQASLDDYTGRSVVLETALFLPPIASASKRGESY